MEERMMIFHILLVWSRLWITALVLYRHSVSIYIQNEDLPPRYLVLRLVHSDEECQVLLELRKALGNRLFEDNDTDVEGDGEVVDMMLLVDARDRAVDVIVNVESLRRKEFRRQIRPSNYCFFSFI